jgi:hypothetical protein
MSCFYCYVDCLRDHCLPMVGSLPYPLKLENVLAYTSVENQQHVPVVLSTCNLKGKAELFFYSDRRRARGRNISLVRCHYDYKNPFWSEKSLKRDLTCHCFLSPLSPITQVLHRRCRRQYRRHRRLQRCRR